MTAAARNAGLQQFAPTNSNVIPLSLGQISTPEEQALYERENKAKMRHTLFNWKVRYITSYHVTSHPIRSLARIVNTCIVHHYD
jgi:hypothetical protein